MDINSDIINAQEIVGGAFIINKVLFSDYSRVYRGTNELISSKCYTDFLKNKRKVLTITASADQLLNAILFGSLDIDCIDITRFSKYYAKLKIAAIKSLNIYEYLSFFAGRINHDLLSMEFYEKIHPYLDSEASMFWDSLYDYFDDVEINESNLFSREIMNKGIMMRNNPYLTNDNYQLLKQKISDANINFYDGNIYEFKGNKLYDLIILSNIIEYCSDMNKYIDFVTKLPLNNNGIALSYLFLFSVMYNNNNENNKLFKENNFDMYEIRNDLNVNGVLVYKKK